MRVSTPIGITIELEQGWFDVTDDLLAEDTPFTLGREQGSGAFQFSIGLYKSGPIPNPSPEVLRGMLLEFAKTRGLGDPSEMQNEETPVRLASATFRTDFFVRVWYISDGMSFGLLDGVSPRMVTFFLQLEEELQRTGHGKTFRGGLKNGSGPANGRRMNRRVRSSKIRPWSNIRRSFSRTARNAEQALAS